MQGWTEEFLHNPSSGKEEIREPYRGCGQKFVMESDQKDRIDYQTRPNSNRQSKKDEFLDKLP